MLIRNGKEKGILRKGNRIFTKFFYQYSIKARLSRVMELTLLKG